jgi:methylmalonyl-CoA mutase N-terminal domain/subunit
MEEEGKQTERFKPNSQAEEQQRDAVIALRASRETAAVDKALNFIRQSARDDRNIVPAVLEAVRAYATIGEINDALRDVYGEYHETTIRL